MLEWLSDRDIIRHAIIKDIINNMSDNYKHKVNYYRIRKSIIVPNISIYHPAIYYIVPNVTIIDLFNHEYDLAVMDDEYINDLSMAILEVILRSAYSDLSYNFGLLTASLNSILEAVVTLLNNTKTYNISVKESILNIDIIKANLTQYVSNLTTLFVESFTNGEFIHSIDTIKDSRDMVTGDYLYHYLTEYYYVTDFHITTYRNKLFCNVIVDNFGIME